MITLDDPSRSPLTTDLLKPGGFAWWYAELLSDDGDGVVLVWSFGLPFLPGLAREARRGRPLPPGARPSLNVAVYRSGKPAFYALREIAPESVTWDGDGRCRFGDTEIVSEAHGTGRTVQVRLDLPTAGGRLRGHIGLTGPIPRVAPGAPGPHRWAPVIGPGFGTATLRSGAFGIHLAGRAYHDRNDSSVGLESLGIRRWLWGHAPHGDTERVFYALWPEAGGEAQCFGLELSPDGSAVERPLTLRLNGTRRTFWGMRTWEQVDLMSGEVPWLRLTLDTRVDNGPFYLRYIVRDSEGGAGSVEVIDPSRVDLDRHRFLVQMRVSPADRRGSFWLPLFEGARGGRAARLLGQLAGRRALEAA